MLDSIYQWLPEEGVNLALVLFLSFLVGLDREERKSDTEFVFGGVRAFPLIGLTGYSLALLAGDQLLPVAIGLAVVGAVLVVSYWYKLQRGLFLGATTEISALTTYLVGPLVYHHHVWVATTLCVASLLLLQLKTALERLAKQTAPDDILTFTKFLLLSAVILPIVPDQPLTPFAINPFRTWLVVVAVSAVSYGSYVVQRLVPSKTSVVLAAVLGGAYSSTITTVVLARRAAGGGQANRYAGAILLASGVMYVRLVALLFLFNRELGKLLLVPFAILAAGAILGGLLWMRRESTPSATEPAQPFTPANPLELRTAFGFALLFVAMLVVTPLAVRYLGRSGVFALAAVMGVTDVDPFIIGMTQHAGTVTPLATASTAVAIAAASNNVAKGVYAYTLGAGRRSLFLLLALAASGSLALLW